MSQWAGGVLTAAGRALQAKVEAGTTLVLTKIKLGDGTEQMSAVDSLTDLVGPKAILGISSATSEDDVATITGVMSATQLTAGFYCREWGLFADDPDEGEILYMITIDAQPEWLPASTEAAQVSATYAMNIAVANATNIEVNIDPAGLVDVDMLNEILGVAERSKAYSVGDLASMPGLPAEHYLRCITAGTTGANTPVLPANIKDGDKISDGTVMWQVTKAMSAAELGYRQPSTAYTAGQIAYHTSLPTGWYLECTTAGTTGSSDLTITSPSIGGTVSDGTVVWTVNRDLPLIGGGALTGTNLTWNANDLGGSAIVAKSLGTNGYIKYASGLIVQWGSYALPYGTNVTEYTLPVPFNVSFTTSSYQIVCSHMTDSINNHTAITVLEGAQYHSSDKFTVRLKLLSEATDPVIYGGVSWFAIGY